MTAGGEDHSTAEAVPAPDDGSGRSPDLHDTTRRLDHAFSVLHSLPPDSFLHGLGLSDPDLGMPQALQRMFPAGRWIPTDQHALTFVAPADHLRVHQAWLEAGHGSTRVSQVVVRIAKPIELPTGEAAGPVGAYDLTLVDLVGVEGIDAVIVALSPAEARAEDTAEVPAVPPPPHARSFRLSILPGDLITGGTDEIADLLGRPLESLVGGPISPIIHPDDVGTATAAWISVIDHPDRSAATRLRLRRADGTWRWFSCTVWNALSDPAIEAVSSEFHDVHEMVEAEQALHASELSFRTLAESMPVGVVLLDEDGRVHFANHRLVTILNRAGVTGPEGPAISPLDIGPGFTAKWAELIRPDLVEDLNDIVRPRDPDDPVPLSRQFQIEGPDGTLFHLLVTATTIRNPDGRSVIVSVQDVSAGVRTSRAHDRLIQVVDEVDDIVVVTDLAGNISYMNQAALSYLVPDDMGRLLPDLMRDELRAFAETAIMPTLEQSERWSGDLEIHDNDGVTHIMATSVRPVHDRDRPELHVGITMRDVTAERAHARELAAQAREDHLTGLPNRMALMELLDEVRQNQGRSALDGGRPDDEIALYFIDLDNLKIVNDSLGHGAGDQLLIAVATELTREAAPDQVARFGGDEFVVVCRRSGPEEAMATAEQFLTGVRRVHVPGVASHLSASIGVATSRRFELDPEGLVRDADAAMYAAKRAGRNRCALFDERLREQAHRRFTVEASLRRALAHGGLDLVHQPVIDLASGLVSGLESLSRWRGSSPTEFIPVAEDSGLIVPLGRNVLERSLHEAAILRASAPGLADLRVGVNVSARELDEPGFAARTLEIIRASDVPTTHVVLELTESVLIDSSDDVGQSLHQLRDAGIQLALDDFGVGYSSLSYLRRFPVEILKLDVSYTQAATTDPETRVIVEAMVTMANRLGIRVVAEGVETLEQLDLVRALGVSWGQGYLLGRPAPLEDLLAADRPHPPVPIRDDGTAATTSG